MVNKVLRLGLWDLSYVTWMDYRKKKKKNREERGVDAINHAVLSVRLAVHSFSLQPCTATISWPPFGASSTLCALQKTMRERERDVKCRQFHHLGTLRCQPHKSPPQWLQFATRRNGADQLWRVRCTTWLSSPCGNLSNMTSPSPPSSPALLLDDDMVSECGLG